MVIIIFFKYLFILFFIFYNFWFFVIIFFIVIFNCDLINIINELIYNYNNKIIKVLIVL